MVLSLDTSTSRIVLALFKDGEIYTKTYDGKEKHASILAPLVDDLLNEANANAREIEVIGLGVGPGSLTGLRVGMSFAVGIAAVNKARIVPLNSLKVISHAVHHCGEKVVIRKARKGYVYLQVFPSGSEPEVLDLDSAKRLISSLDDPILVGDGKEFFDGLKALDFLDKPVPCALMDLTLKNLEDAVDYIHVKPLYVQKSIAEINFEKRKKG